MCNKTLSETIRAVKQGGKPGYDELLYAVLVLEALHIFDELALMRLSDAEGKKLKPVWTTSAIWQYNEAFDRSKGAFEKSPKEWLGWNNDPKNPEYIERIKQGNNLFGRINGTVRRDQ